MRTSMRWEKMSALCTFIEITDRWGASSLKVDAQPLNAHDNASSTPGQYTRSRMQHFRGHEHDALVRDQEPFRIFGTVVTDARVRRQLAVLVDDGVPDLAVRPNVDVGQHDRPLDVGALLDPHSREQQRLADGGTRDDGAARHERVDRDAAAAVLVEHEFRGRR